MRLAPELGAIIVAGGKGSRMGEQGQMRPKVLHEVGGRSLLDHHLHALMEAGVEPAHTVIATGHLHDLVTAAAPHVRTAVDPFPLGSGGCLGPISPPANTVIVILGDVYSTVDYAALVHHHLGEDAVATVVVHPNDHPGDSDLVSLNAGGQINALHRKPHANDEVIDNQAIAGVYVLDQSVWDHIHPEQFADLAHDILPRLLDAGLKIVAHSTVAYMKDAGTPERLAHVQADFANGRVALHSGRRPTAFLDRDGTLNQHKGHISQPEQISLCPGAADAVLALNHAGVLVVVVTNQPVLARGECSVETLHAIHARLCWLLGQHGAFIDRVYWCPHHPDAGYAGEVAELKVVCGCRKPAPGMIQRAVEELPVDRTRSALFGDTQRDEGAARAAGIPFYRVGQEHSLHEQVEEWLGREDC